MHPLVTCQVPNLLGVDAAITVFVKKLLALAQTIGNVGEPLWLSGKVVKMRK
jgi:hypothetical protein